jgi:hypothetical protein
MTIRVVTRMYTAVAIAAIAREYPGNARCWISLEGEFSHGHFAVYSGTFQKLGSEYGVA